MANGKRTAYERTVNVLSTTVVIIIMAALSEVFSLLPFGISRDQWFMYMVAYMVILRID